MNYWKKERYKRTILQNLTFSNLFLLIQIIMFIIMTLKGGSTNPGILVYYGARANAFIILFHEYWRFITPIFLHIGLEHFAMNSLFLYFFGNQLESIVGHGRFLVIYLLSGIMGNLASFAFNAQHISAGASTSLFGLFGLMLYLSTRHRYIYAFRELGMQYMALLVMNLITSLFSSTIDLSGHIGGLVGGYVISSVVSFRGDRVTKMYERVLFAIIYILVAIVLFKIGIEIGKEML